MFCFFVGVDVGVERVLGFCVRGWVCIVLGVGVGVVY